MDNDTELELNKTKDKRQKTKDKRRWRLDVKILRYQEIKTGDDKLRMKNEG